ncbi:MAG: hypothetical protein QW739_01110 [Candidatus Odinarchaeota archaeon]
MFIEKLLKMLESNLNRELLEFIIPPNNSVKKSTIIYHGGLLAEPAVNAFSRRSSVKEDFKKHISTNLSLGYTPAECVDQTLTLRRLVGSLCFPSPLESYARRRILEDLKNIKSDWILGVGEQANHKIFFYLNFTLPKIKAIYRAELPLNFNPDDTSNYTLRRFLDSFKDYLEQFKTISAKAGLDWVKITQTSIGYRVIIISEAGRISEHIVEL